MLQEAITKGTGILGKPLNIFVHLCAQLPAPRTRSMCLASIQAFALPKKFPNAGTTPWQGPH